MVVPLYKCFLLMSLSVFPANLSPFAAQGAHAGDWMLSDYDVGGRGGGAAAGASVGDPNFGFDQLKSEDWSDQLASEVGGARLNEMRRVLCNAPGQPDGAAGWCAGCLRCRARWARCRDGGCRCGSSPHSPCNTSPLRSPASPKATAALMSDPQTPLCNTTIQLSRPRTPPAGQRGQQLQEGAARAVRHAAADHGQPGARDGGGAAHGGRGAGGQPRGGDALGWQEGVGSCCGGSGLCCSLLSRRCADRVPSHLPPPLPFDYS